MLLNVVLLYLFLLFLLILNYALLLLWSNDELSISGKRLWSILAIIIFLVINVGVMHIFTEAILPALLLFLLALVIYIVIFTLISSLVVIVRSKRQRGAIKLFFQDLLSDIYNELYHLKQDVVQFIKDCANPKY